MWPVVIDRVVWSVCLSVHHDREPCKNGWTDRDAVWAVDCDGPKEPCIIWVSRCPVVIGYFEGGGVRPVLKYRDYLPWAVKTVNRARCRFDYSVGWAQGVTLAPPIEYDWTVHVRRRCGRMWNYFDHLFVVAKQWRRLSHEQKTRWPGCR